MRSGLRVGAAAAGQDAVARRRAGSWGSWLSRGHRVLLQQPHRLLQHQPHNKLGVGVTVGVTGWCCSSRAGCCSTQETGVGVESGSPDAAAAAAHAAAAAAAQKARGRGHRLVLQQPDRVLQHTGRQEAGGRGRLVVTGCCSSSLCGCCCSRPSEESWSAGIEVRVSFPVFNFTLI